MIVEPIPSVGVGSIVIIGTGVGVSVDNNGVDTGGKVDAVGVALAQAVNTKSNKEAKKLNGKNLFFIFHLM